MKRGTTTRAVRLAVLALACGITPLRSQAAQVCRSERVAVPRTRDEVRRHQADSALVAALRAEAADEARESGASQPGGILFVLKQAGDSDVVVKPHALNFRPTPALEVIARAQLASWPAREPFRRAVRLDTVPVPEAKAGSRQVECRPSLINREEAQQALYSFLWHYPAARRLTGRHTRLVLAMVATRDGRGAVPAVVQSSGLPEVDEFAAGAFAERLRFMPARVAGVPVDVVVTLPLDLSLPGSWRPLLTPP